METSTPTTLNLREPLYAIFKRRHIVLAFALAVLGVTAFMVLRTEPVYRASTRLLVKKGRAEVPVSPKDSPATIGRVTEQELNSEIEMLRSRWLFEQTVTRLKQDSTLPVIELGWLARTRESFHDVRMSDHDRWVLNLEDNVSAEVVGRSNLIRISYVSQSPEWSQRVVNALTETYFDQRNQVFQSQQTVAFFADQMERARVRLNSAESELQDYLDAAGISLTPGADLKDPMAAQRSSVAARAGKLEDRISEARAGLRESTRRLEVLEQRLEQEPERVATSDRAYHDPNIASMEQALVELKLRRDELRQAFTPTGRVMQDIDAQIRAAEQRISSAEISPGLDRTQPNPVHDNLKIEVLLAQTEVEGYRARLDAAVEDMEEERQRLGPMTEESLTVERLVLASEAAKEAFVLYQRKHEEARMSSAMDDEKIVNVSIAQHAQRPLRPEPSQRPMMLALGLFVASVCSVGLALLMESMDDTVFTGDDLEKRLALTHLGSIAEGDVGSSQFEVDRDNRP